MALDSISVRLLADRFPEEREFSMKAVVNSWLTGKSVLITGASGTVATGLLHEVLAAQPKVIRALDCHEHGLFQLQQKIGHREELRLLLGDIRDGNRMRRAMEGIDVVFHCAALKHVSIGEYNPFEIVQTNLVGLQNIIQAAIDCRVDRVIFTSSDKAVNPTNAMGASKLMGERLVAAANEMRGSAPTRFASVRFGNILGSNGSVVDIFRKQIKRGGPVTLTDHKMTRFVMGLEKAVRLVLRAADLMVGGEVFVLKMPALRIADLAKVMIQGLAPKYDLFPDDITVVEIGAKRGEKLFEELLTEAEVPRSFEDSDLIVFLGDHAEWEAAAQRDYLRHMEPVTDFYHSGRLPLMSPPQIQDFLTTSGVLQFMEMAEAGR
jgi:UDP-N-acetylglucosamine 4,6-dehydratase